jgi:hypothetical protein
LKFTAFLVLTGLALSACGPALTDPSSTNISGTWVAPGPAAGLTNMSVTVSQAADGTLSGTYRAIGTPSLQTCPPSPPCTISGKVSGANNAVQVLIYLNSAGNFTGQVTAPGTIKGAMQWGSTVQPVAFTGP